jgi:hypothetical protein
MFGKSLWSFTILLSIQVTPASSFLPVGRSFEPLSQPSPAPAFDKTTVLSRQERPATPLWPGSHFTELDRARALSRGLRYIYRTSLNPRNFAEHASDYMFLFQTLSVAMHDQSLKQTAQRMGVERARLWRHQHPSLPRNADAYTISLYAFASSDADDLNVPDRRMKEQIRQAASRYPAKDYLFFNPLIEPPPGDVPEYCEYDGADNSRGSKFCRVCKRRLKMRSRYDVWCDALIMTYSGEHYGVELGARYTDVLKWAPAMRPYRGKERGKNPDFFDSVFAITHIIYTLNNYSQYRLSPALLPQEYQFLKTNLREAMAERNPDMIGEFMDTLRSFGLTTEDPEIRSGMEYFLSHQNADGSWGRKSVHNRYHETWNGIGALADYDWPSGEGLSFPELKPLLESWNAGVR